LPLTVSSREPKTEVATAKAVPRSGAMPSGVSALPSPAETLTKPRVGAGC